MAVEKRAGGTIKVGTPFADNVRNVLQSVANLFNQDMVERVFEDASIPDSKLVSGGGTPSAIYYAGGTNSLKSTNANTNTGVNGISIGYGAGGVNSPSSISIGTNSAVNSGGGVSIGYANNINGLFSIGLGYGINITPANCIAIGYGNNIGVDSQFSIAIGSGSTIGTMSYYSICIGNQSYIGNNNYNSIAIGSSAGVGGYQSIAIGYGVVNNIDDSVRIGSSNANVFTLSSSGEFAVTALRINTAPVAETPTATHTLTINLNGTDYKFLCVAA